MIALNIHTKDIELFLDSKKYKINVLGGWGVKFGDFNVSIENSLSKELILAKRTKWPVQSYINGNRSKRILTIDVPVKGDYKVILKNPKTLEIKKSNLPIKSLFMEPIDNRKIEIYFH